MTKSPNDLKTKQHNVRQLALFAQIRHNEEWYLSEELGFDCNLSAQGRELLSNRIGEVILQGAGSWMNKEINQNIQ